MKIKIVLLLISNILFAQQSKEILTTIDSTKVKIGEEIKYGIKIKSDSLFFVEFPAKPFFTWYLQIYFFLKYSIKGFKKKLFKGL